ncbi:hypothetical protein BKK56_04500 [Rodentibacter genomosp. 2]|uniref:siderophore-interacting protein n=1 Tax=Rodentibacter genomosp. 2 TaxID=1908266 RepID=UPI000984BD96|nr:hypothetical protein BKK56_04500 [Rodentibacter genomosp. 2]
MTNNQDKIDLIEHVNEDHLAELLDISQVFCSPNIKTVKLNDVFENGIEILADSKKYFVPFNLQIGDPHEKIQYLAYSAKIRLGKPLNAKTNRYFEVLATEKVTPNMLRLTLKSDVPIPDEIGLAWNFSLKTLEKMPKIVEFSTKLTACGKLFHRILLWGLRYLSVEKRGRVLYSFYKDRRYYTLRSALKSGEKNFYDLALVDIYLHGDTRGGMWANGLQIGDIISAGAEYHEHTEHLQSGYCVLIGDETALPTVASILEKWQNPISPVVICLTQSQAEQSYLSDEAMSNVGKIHYIQSTSNATNIIDVLKSLPQIDNVWGAFEHQNAKEVRFYLRTERGLSANQNRVKGYWIKR